MVAVAESPKLNQNSKPCLINTGKNIKNNKEGSTNQAIWQENAAIWVDSIPSKCIQIIASNDVSGKAASNAAKPLWRLAISEISTMSSAEIQSLMV